MTSSRIAGMLFVVFGSGHLVGTVLDLMGIPLIFQPVDLGVVAPMQETIPVISDLLWARMSVWDLYYGCSASLSLGLVATGILAWVARPERKLLGFLALSAWVWAAIAWRYFFWVPASAFSVAAALLSWGAIRAPRLAWTGQQHLWFWWVAPLWLLGGPFHLLGAIVESQIPFVFQPVDGTVQQVMASTDVRIVATFRATRDVWDAYIGFNQGHGWGLVTYGLGLWAIGRAQPELLARKGFRWGIAIFSMAWLLVASTLFFYGPVMLAAVAVVGHTRLAVRAPEPT